MVPIESGSLGGAIITNVFAGLSAFALVTIMSRMVALSLSYRLSRGRAAIPTEYAFFSTNFGCYGACLLLATMLTAGAGLISVKWTVMQAISDGNVCKLQVVITQLGNWSTAYFTVAIAVHTFNSLVLRVRQSGIICNVTMVVGWVIAFVAGVVPVVIRPSQYGPSLVTCDFLPAFGRTKFLLHVLPILISSILSTGMYSVTFLVLRGTLSLKGGIRFTVNPSERRSTIQTDPSYHHIFERVAGAMIWFPIAYTTLLVPYSILQLLVISGFNVSFGALVFSSVLWFDLGVVNVLLMYNVFRVLEPVIDSSAISKRPEENLLLVYRDSKKPESRQSPDGNCSSISEYGLPNEYGDIIRPGATYKGGPGRPTIPRPNPELPRRPDRRPSVASQVPSNLAAAGRRGSAHPVRPPRPAPQDVEGIALEVPSPIRDQPTPPKDAPQMIDPARKWQARLRELRSMSNNDAKPVRPRSMGSDPPSDNFI